MARLREVSNRTAYIRKQYAYEIAGMYFVERTVDMFPPPEPSVAFEMHQDLTVFYRDDRSGDLKAKGFFVEGFVTSSTLDVQAGGERIVITRAGLRVRRTALKSLCCRARIQPRQHA